MRPNPLMAILRDMNASPTEKARQSNDRANHGQPAEPDGATLPARLSSGMTFAALRLLLCLAWAIELRDARAAPPLLVAAALTPLLTLGLGFWPKLGAGLSALALVFATTRGADPLSAVFLLSVLIFCVPPIEPHGVVGTRGRLDPGGGFRVTDTMLAAGYAARALAVAGDLPGVLGIQGGLQGALHLQASYLLGGVGLLLGATLSNPALRRFGFFILLLAELYTLTTGASFGFLPLRLLLIFATFETSLIGPRAPGTVDRVFYDGACGLCHTAVRCLLAEDTQGALRFAPIGGETFVSLAVGTAAFDIDLKGELPDSLIVLTADGRVLFRARAVLHATARLGGYARLVAFLLERVPTRLANAAYDAIARVRHRVFRRPDEACPLMPAYLRERFDA